MSVFTQKTFANGRFQVHRTLGKGSVGIVYEALDKERNMPVALKTLLHMDTDNLFYFKREFRALHDLVHPNLCSFMELINDDGVWFLTMELLHGLDFRTYVENPFMSATLDVLSQLIPNQDDKERMRSGNDSESVSNGSAFPGFPPFDEKRLRQSLAGLCEGLNALHLAGKIHRDIKPSNVMITDEGRVVLLDFGLVTDKGVKMQTEQGSLIGTAAYMSPEQAHSDVVGPESDWYSVGVMLYEVLAGRLPFDGTPLAMIMQKQTTVPTRPGETRPGVPEDLELLCLDLLSIGPSSRPRPEAILEIVNVGHQVSFIPPVFTTTMSSQETLFVGRNEELRVLKNAFQKSASGSFNVVVIEGVSGVGKSALIENFTADVVANVPETVVLKGRCFERESAPFKAFDGVIESFIEHLRQLSESEAARLRPHHADLLIRLFPALMRSPLFSDLPFPSKEEEDTQELQSRAFDALVEVLFELGSRRPLLVVIDDLQWADADSLVLLQFLTRVYNTPPLLLVILSRFSKNEEDSVLDWNQLLTENHERIHLNTLNDRDSEQLARQCIQRKRVSLDVDPSLIAKEASGHPLYLAELVHHIAEGATDWTSLRLDDVIWTRVSALPKQSRELLETICVAGTPVEREHLQLINRLDSEDFYRSIALLRSGNLIRSRGPRKNHLIEAYHDRVREAVITHCPDKDKVADVHLKIGRFLLNTYSAEALDENIYSVARHLNEARRLIVDPEGKRRLARLNLNAGIKAKTASAYASALDYFMKSLELTREIAEETPERESWRVDYEQNLELFTKIAETGFLLDDRELMQEYGLAVIKNARNLLDKVKVYEILIQEAEARSDVKNAVSIALDILGQLGVKMSPSPSKARVVLELIKTKRLLKSRTIEDILHASEMTDPYAKAIVQISHRSSAVMYFTSKNLMAVNVFRRLRFCLNYGNTPASICVFASYAIICCGILRKFEEGYKYGKLSMDLLEKYNIREYRGAAIFRFNSFIKFWKEPLFSALLPLKESFHCCIDAGDFSTAAYPAFNYSYMSFLVGRPMQDYLHDSDDFIEALKKIGEQNGLRILLSFRQFADNVINKGDNQGIMDGPHCNENEVIPIYIKDENRTGLFAIFFGKMLLSFLFEDTDNLLDYRKQCHEYIDGVSSTYIESLFYFYDALIWMAVWDKLSARERKTAHKSILADLKLLNKFRDSCEANYKNKYLLVKAEHSRVKGDFGIAGELYQRSIDCALENGFLNEAGIACELFSRFSFGQKKSAAGTALLKKAILYYESWGALAKVRHLREKQDGGIDKQYALGEKALEI